jgi:hypothetical protein
MWQRFSTGAAQVGNLCHIHLRGQLPELKTFMTWRTCLALLAVGLGMLIGGLVYDLTLGGLFRSPAPELRDQFLMHARIARSIEAAGLLIWSLGLVNAVLMTMHDRISNRPTHEARPRQYDQDGGEHAIRLVEQMQSSSDGRPTSVPEDSVDN